MQSITLLVGLILSFTTIIIRPINGLLIFIVSMIWYPTFLSFSLGSLDFSVSRIVIIFLSLKILLISNKIKSFKWCYMDSLIMSYVAGKFIAVSTNLPLLVVIEREAGQFVDTILPYFAIRFVITSRSEMIYFFKNVVFLSLPLPFLGLYQSLTGNNVFSLFGAASHNFMRNGFYRSTLTFYVWIIYGLYFSFISIISLGLKNYLNFNIWKVLTIFLVLFLGVLTSMSSAPIFSIFVSMFVIVLYRFRRLTPLFLLFIFASILFLEFYSNRHWYEVLTRFAGNEETAYYRIGLINEAFGGGMDGHWLFGYGYVGIGPGNFNQFFHWKFRDLVNIYIHNLAHYGLFGLVPFLLINVNYYFTLSTGFKHAFYEADRWFIWCLSAAIIGWNVAMMTVSSLGEVNTLLYMIIAICTNIPVFISQKTNTTNKSITIS